MGPNRWQLSLIKYFTDTIGGQVLVFFNIHNTRMNLMEEKQEEQSLWASIDCQSISSNISPTLLGSSTCLFH